MGAAGLGKSGRRRIRLVNVNTRIVFSEVGIKTRLLGLGSCEELCDDILMSVFESFDCVQSQQSLL